MKVHGNCHCGGAIRFEADADPKKAGVCHCTDCQSLTGSAFSLFLQVPKENFSLTSGEPKIYVWASAEKDPPVFNLRLGTIRERSRAAAEGAAMVAFSAALGDELGTIQREEKGIPT